MISRGRVAPPGRGLTTNRVVFLIGIVLAVAAFGGVLFLLRSNSVPTQQVVVAATDLSAGATLDGNSVTTAAVAQGSVPADAITDPAQVQGKVLAVSVRQNTPITRSLLAGAAGGAGPTAHLDITQGYVAVALPASYTFVAPPPSEAYALTGGNADLVSGGFYIQPEDHIDILVATPSDNGPTLHYAFQDVRVLKVGDNAGGQSGQAAGAPSSLLVEIPRSQAPMLAALATVSCNSSHPNASDCQAPQIVRYVLRPTCQDGDRNYAADVKSLTGKTVDQLDSSDTAKLAAACKFPYPNYLPVPNDVLPSDLNSQGNYKSP